MTELAASPVGATTGGGTAFGAAVCALGGAGAGAAGDVVAGRDAPLDVEDGTGAFEPGSDVIDGLIGGGGVRCATRARRHDSPRRRWSQQKNDERETDEPECDRCDTVHNQCLH